MSRQGHAAARSRLPALSSVDTLRAANHDRTIITVHPGSPVAPYEQVREQIRAQVAAAVHRLRRAASSRRLAGDLGLAPNTVACAYRDLEALGVIETRGRAGSVLSGPGVVQAARLAVRRVRREVAGAGVRPGRGSGAPVAGVRLTIRSAPLRRAATGRARPRDRLNAR